MEAVLEVPGQAAKGFSARRVSVDADDGRRLGSAPFQVVQKQSIDRKEFALRLRGSGHWEAPRRQFGRSDPLPGCNQASRKGVLSCDGVRIRLLGSGDAFG